MLLFIRDTQGSTVSLLRGLGLGASVGPTSVTGWTAAWADASTGSLPDLPAGRRVVALEETSRGPGLRIRAEREGASELRWRPGRDRAAASAAAARLTALFGPPGQEAAVAALLWSDGHDADSLLAGLEGLLDLPEVEEPPPEAVVVAHRGDPAMARLTAAMAGPAWFHPGEQGWAVLRPHEEGEADGTAMAAGVSAGGRRRDATVLAWRGGPACGVVIWRRGRPISQWVWNSGWQFTEADDVAVQGEVCDELARSGTVPVDRALLRALLRREQTSQDPLAQLAELLGWPAEVLHLLDTPDRTQLGAELVTPATRAQAAATFVFADPAPHGSRRPWLWALWPGVVALFMLAMTVLGISTLATDGASLGEHRTGPGDWLWTTALAVFTLIFMGTTAHRLRRLNRRP